MKAETIYILRQPPNGELYIEDRLSIYFDKTKAEQARDMQQNGEEQYRKECQAKGEEVSTGDWTIQEFIAISAAESSPLLSQADGGLRERTLRRLAENVKEAMKIYG